jgi:hypothetical protein
MALPDPITTALAIGSIAGIFTSCVDCFDYVQLSREFDQDLGFCLTRLSAAQLRLTRWGKSVGLIIEDPSNAAEIAAAEKLRNMGYPQKEIEKAEEWLNDIVTTFETARKQSERYSRGKEPVPVFDPRSASDLKLVKEDSVKRLFPKIRAIIHRRKAGVQRVQSKTAWALRGRRYYKDLVESLRDIVNDLVELFPAMKEPQTEIAEAEVKELDAQDLPALKAAIQEDDPILSDAVDKETREVLRRDPTIKFSGITIDGNAVFFAGEVTDDGAPTVSMKFNDSKAAGSSVSVIGRIAGKYSAGFMDSMSRAGNSQPKPGNGGQTGN